MAESELSVLSGQCLDRRIPDRQTLIEEVTAWQEDRNNNHAKADWQFTTADARVKLKRLSNDGACRRHSPQCPGAVRSYDQSYEHPLPEKCAPPCRPHPSPTTFGTKSNAPSIVEAPTPVTQKVHGCKALPR